LYEVPKDPVTSGNAEAGVFAYVQTDAALSGPEAGSVDEILEHRRRSPTAFWPYARLALKAARSAHRARPGLRSCLRPAPARPVSVPRTGIASGPRVELRTGVATVRTSLRLGIGRHRDGGGAVPDCGSIVVSVGAPIPSAVALGRAEQTRPRASRSFVQWRAPPGRPEPRPLHGVWVDGGRDGSWGSHGLCESEM
jgi:hypothetical protein